MDPFLLTALGLLGLLAVLDLFVGVSNDAVNFLNSAVGSRTAPFRIVLTVAAAGVLLGATFSSGMMEVARSGVLMPEKFTFNDVMVVFCAVMVADVLLLNLFNALGLPTSTTVSIIFELLGATATLAFWKIWQAGEPLADIGAYVNSGKALSMIMAILVSVAVAFVAGLVVQFLLRLVFSFRYEKAYRYLGGLFGGIAMTSLFYFLIMKGAKGASFMTPERLAFLKDNSDLILWSCFIGFTVLFQALITFFNTNVLRYVILAGTFSLAFAFAGNDLVNFVGVPLAALDSWHIFSAAPGADPAVLTMEGLREPFAASTGWLVASGLVMVVTLYCSKKAHRVIRTSVNLSSSTRGGREQFGSSLPARVLVRASLNANTLIRQFLPESVLEGIGSRYKKKTLQPGERELPFDEIRACVNLVVAAALIASATSLKLPLSTTYVTFMVAMGSSLADGAWDRESAVYRISGVLTVISGWFMTALSAASFCAIVTLLFQTFGMGLMIAGMVVALVVIIKTNFLTKEKEKSIEEDEGIAGGDVETIRTLLKEAIPVERSRTITLLADSIDAFLVADAQKLTDCRDAAVDLLEEVSVARGNYYRMALYQGTKADRDARNFYYRSYSAMKDLAHGLRDQVSVSENYVKNSHSAMTGLMAENLAQISAELNRLKADFTTERAQALLALLDKAQSDYLVQSNTESVSLRKSELYLGKILYTRELVTRYQMVSFLEARLNFQA